MKKNKICPQPTVCIDFLGTGKKKDMKYPKKYKCPTCKRKLKVYVYDCHYLLGFSYNEQGCWHAAIPGGHKRKKWWKK